MIKERTSRRTYDPLVLNPEDIKLMKKAMLLEDIKTPFSKYTGNCRFSLVSVPEFDPNEQKRIGTYGLIKGARQFIVGAVEKSNYDREHFGYLMEVILLYATDLGLGTCWLGGFFNRSLFSEKINATPNEIVPAISPIGYFPKKRRTKEKIIRAAIKADNRKPWEQIFFKDKFNNPLSELDSKDYSTLFEMVRIAPSASNRQPWRILKEHKNNIYHFYTVKAKGFYEQMVALDIGIAISHWDLSAKEMGITGEWDIKQLDLDRSENLKYVISWIGN